jgi:glycosyltransferase involved in cell wall biosynthesis
MVSHSALPGGSNTVLLALLRHQAAGVSCSCIFLAPGPVVEAARALGAGVDVIDVGRARELWRVPGAIAALRGAIRAANADVVFAHVSKAHLYAAPAARLEKLPYLWWQHETARHKRGLQELAGRLRAGAVICSSQWIAAEQQRRWPRTPAEAIHPGVELGQLGERREHVAGAGNAVVVGIVGRLQRWKRVELALRVLPPLLAVEPYLTLRVIGAAEPGLDEDYPQQLRDEAAALGVEDSVRFLGQLPDARGAIADLDVLVHTADQEPFGLVLVEAMLAGVPVVAPPEGGPAEIIRDGVDGLLVDPCDAVALSAALAELVRDPARRAEMGAAGRTRALEHFSAERMARDAWAVVERVSYG